MTLPVPVDLVADGEPLRVFVDPPSRADLDELINAHPPDGSPDAEPRRWGPGFEAALLARAVVDPRPTVAEAARWWEDWGAAADALVVAATANLPDPHDLDVPLARYRADARYALEVEYCSRAGMPRSVFLTWAHTDQATALAGLLASRDRCPGCGIPTQLMDRADLGTIDTRRCAHCELLEQARESIPADQRAGIHLSVVPARAEEG